MSTSPPRPWRRWTCEACGETIPPQFGFCWKCGRAREGGDGAPLGERADRAPGTAAAAAPGVEEQREFGPEILTVLFLSLLPSLGAAAWAIFSSAKASPISSSLIRLLSGLLVGAPALYSIARSPEPWSRFGLGRPRWLLDGSLAVLILLLQSIPIPYIPFIWAAILMGHARDFTVQYPEPTAFLLLGFSACVSAIAEELLLRGYLIPRLEGFLGGSVRAVLTVWLISFAFHADDLLSPKLLYVLLIGLFHSACFAVSRRLWPLIAVNALGTVAMSFWCP